jgi:hypothetical protein
MALFRGLEARGIYVRKDNVHKVVTLLEGIGQASPEAVHAYLNRTDADEVRRVLNAVRNTA